jgi:hypothetical protein
MTRSIIAAAITLAELLDLENSALRALDFAGAVALFPAKQRAADNFAVAQAQLGALPSALRPEFERTTRRLKDLAADNRRLLEHAITVQGRVIGIVVKALPRALDSAPRYGAQGANSRARLPPVALSASA